MGCCERCCLYYFLYFTEVPVKNQQYKIKELGYNLVTIWEYDWKKINRCIKILQHKFRKYHK